MTAHHHHTAVLPRSYRRGAYLFVIVALAMLIFALYLGWAHVVIVITPSGATTTRQFTVTTTDPASGNADIEHGIVQAVIASADLADVQTFPATGTTDQKPATDGTIGTVTIINNYSKSQTLIEKTRLVAAADPATILLRLKKTVVVPAGGRVVVPVTAEALGTKSLKAGDRLIIPGLWQPLWEKIYAEVPQDLRSTGSTVIIVTGDDITQAQQKLKQSIYQKLADQLQQQVAGDQAAWPKIMSSEIVASTPSMTEGQVATEFSLSMKVQATLIALNQQQVAAVAERQLIDAATGVSVGSLGEMTYTLDAYDSAMKQARIKVTATATTKSGQEQLAQFDKHQLLGKTVEEVKAYFAQFPGVANVDVQFSPSWLKKTPRIEDKLELQVAVP